MLQRAASNACSWWWATHIRTKQSKWMEQNLLDMEEKAQYTLKLLQEEGDSFAKRAEMYYKKRPELISFVEESFKAYKALADRYDHISTELQNANTTIASVFPDQGQFMEEDDDDKTPAQFRKPQSSQPKGNIPNVPKMPAKSLKCMVNIATKKLQPKKSMKASTIVNHPKSGLTEPEAITEIDKLQKDILSLQTEKEFLKSSYESGLARYMDIDKYIAEKQERICSLQDEFGTSMVIDDDEARRLMAAAALKSCQEKLTQLQEKQEQSANEARVERRRIRESREKLDFLKGRLLGDETEKEDLSPEHAAAKSAESLARLEEEEMNNTAEKMKELDSIREKIKDHFEVGDNASLSVSDMAEKIDELVNKVISLETAVSSQTALIHSLRTETDDLQEQINTLEDDKGTLQDDKNILTSKLKDLEEKMLHLQDLNRSAEDQGINLQTHFTEADCKLGHLSVKLENVKPDEELEITDSSFTEEESPESPEDSIGSEFTPDPKDEPEKPPSPKVDVELKVSSSPPKRVSRVTFKGLDDKLDNDNGSDSQKAVVTPSQEPDSLSGKQDLSLKVDSIEIDEPTEIEDEPDWKQLFLSGIEDREQKLLTEYTTILRNSKEVKRKLKEAETELNSSNAVKDAEIRALRQKLKLLQTSISKNSDVKETSLPDSQQEESSEERNLTTCPTNEDGIDMMLTDQPQNTSQLEEQFRANIDELLEENLEFWLKFSTSFHQIQKFDSSAQDLQAEITKLEEKKKTEGSSITKYGVRSDVRPIYRHLREIHTELIVWLEKSTLLKEELKSRFSSLCGIQDEITKAMKATDEDDEFKFTSYQAAKFQGEVLNMKQENNKITDQLQAGLDHITSLQLDVEKTLAKLTEEFALTNSKKGSSIHLQHSESRSRVPLRSFIFGVKPKKQKTSIFSCMHPSKQFLRMDRILQKLLEL